MSKPQGRDTIVLTGYTHVIGALADLYPSRELGRRRVATGDLKLWCHMQHVKGRSVAAGQFRAAVFDGKKWRTFRLNFVADEDARYSGFDERTRKARRCFDALATLKGQNAYWRESTFGIVATRKAEPALAASTVSRAPSAGATASAANMAQVVATTPVAAITTQAAKPAPGPATGTLSKGGKVSGRRKRRKPTDDRQMTLF